jgi:Tol biopolymer transport system component
MSIVVESSSCFERARVSDLHCGDAFASSCDHGRAIARGSSRLARSALLALALTAPNLRAAPQSVTTRVDVGPGGVQTNFASDGGLVSSDGRYVVYTSLATNLVPGDVNGVQDIFRFDRQTGVTVLVSVATGGAQANGDSRSPSMSADGRYIAFASDASNLTQVDQNFAVDLFVRDMVAGTTTLVTPSHSGFGTANATSWSPSISRDGRFVAFYSAASDLLTSMPDLNGRWDTFLFDTQTGSITLVSLNSQGQQGNDDSADDPDVPGATPAISGDGRFVAFESIASNFVPNYTVGHLDVYLRDTMLGTTTLVSASAGGVRGNNYSRAPSISADGRYVAFGSSASNLVPNDTNAHYDVFVKDVHTGAIERVDVSTSGAQGSGGGLGPHPVSGTFLSADGRFVCFGAQYTNLVPGDTNGAWDVFVHDRLLGTTVLANVNTAGAQANDFSDPVSISDDGSVIVFGSLATNLVSNDTNGENDVFVRATALPYSSFCLGDGEAQATACPCTNSGELGHGCDNSQSTGGGLLFATGTASVGADTIALRAFGLPHASVAIFLQGTAQQNAGLGTVLGDGLRCLAGTQIRLGHHTSSSSGSAAFGFGFASDPSVSMRGAIPSAGGTRYYQVHYRDGASFCSSESFNWTNAIRVVWSP